MQIIFAPDWFIGKDVLIDFFSFIVLVVFSYLSLKSYRLGKKKNILYLCAGFFLIAFAQLALILTKLVFYYDTTFTKEIGLAAVTYHIVKSVDIFYHIGLFCNKLLTLVGLFIIYRLPLKKISRSDFLLAVYFILISAVLSIFFFYVFHLTVLMLVALIISNYLCIYKKNRNPNTKLLLAGFILFGFANLIFTFSTIGEVYVAGNIIELISFLVFLGVIGKILRTAKT